MATTQPNGYLATPANGVGRGVLILHPWWGLNDTIKSFCDRLANAGFVAFAPDMFDGKVATTIAAAEALTKDADAEHVRALVAQATEFLSERTAQSGHKLAVMGFSFGAYFALELSVTKPEHIDSVVVFYGCRPESYAKSQSRYLGHFAEHDDYEPEEYVKATEKALSDANRAFKFYRYPATRHWFAEPDRSDAYNREAAELAWERTLQFLSGQSA